MKEQRAIWDADPIGEGRRARRWFAIRAGAATAVGALVLGLILGPAFAGKPALATDPTSGEHTISVSGVGVVSVKPDLADVTIGVSAERGSAKEARDAAATSMASVVASIKKNGIDDKDIVTTNLSLEPVYDYSGKTPRLTGQRFTNVVRVTVRKIDTLPDVVDNAVAAGATQISGIAFRVSDPKAAQAQARQAAMDDARAKADALAKAGGVTIKGVASISESGGVQVTPTYATYDSMRAAGAAPTPIQTGTTDVQIQVAVSYLIG